MLDAQPIEVLLDALVCPLGRLLQREAVFNPLDGPLNGRRDTLDTLLNGIAEHGDVALPAWGPLDSLLGKTLVGARSHQVEGREASDAGSAHAEHLGPGGGGDADGHVGR